MVLSALKGSNALRFLAAVKPLESLASLDSLNPQSPKVLSALEVFHALRILGALKPFDSLVSVNPLKSSES